MAWQEELALLVEEASTRHTGLPEIIDACLALAGRCDVADLDEVALVLVNLDHLVSHLRGRAGPADLAEAEQADEIADVAAGIALACFEAVQEVGPIRGLSGALVRWGRAVAAHELVSEALRRAERRPRDGRPPPAALLLNLRGEQMRQVGDLDGAQADFEQALKLLDRATAGSDELGGVVHNNLGLLLQTLGDLAGARAHLVRSLELADDPLSRAVTLDNLGTVEADLAARSGPLILDDGLVNVIVEEHLRQAHHYFADAQQLLAGLLPEHAETYADSLWNRFTAAQLGEDPGLRTRLRDQLVEVAGEHPLPPRLQWCVAVADGTVLLEQDHAEQAVAVLDSQARQIETDAVGAEGMAQGMGVLLRAAARVGDQELVEGVGRFVADLDAQTLPDLLVGRSEPETQRRLAVYVDRAESVLGGCLAGASTGELPAWLYDLVLARKGVLGERQGAGWLAARDGEGGDLGELLQELRQLRAEVADLDLHGAGETMIRRARRRHEEAHRRLGRAEGRLHQALAHHRPPLQAVTTEALRERLDPDTMLLDLTVARHPDGSRHYVAVEVRADGPVRFRDLGAVESADQLLCELSTALARRAVSTVQAELRELLLAELSAILFDPATVLPRRLLVAPTGRWGMAPWTLLWGPDRRPLIDEHDVALVPSGRWLVTRPGWAGPGRPGPPVVLGDPDVDLDHAGQVSFFLSMRFPRLAHSAREAAGVAALLGVAPLTGRAATRQALLDVHSPRVLHVAAHGAFLSALGSVVELGEPRGQLLRPVGDTVVAEEDEGLWGVPGPDDGGHAAPDARSVHLSRVRWLREVGPTGRLTRAGLFLAGCNAWLAGVDTPQDVGTGVVTAGELAVLDLGATEVAVLSACSTGVGVVDVADGSVLGLRTAALVAGAACCIASLWEVDDIVTAELMVAFHREFAAGSSASAALRVAQLAVRARHPDPYFWAGWVVEGLGPSTTGPADRAGVTARAPQP